MSDPLASTLAELRRRLEAEGPAADDSAEPPAEGVPAGDLWQLSELELDRLMGRRLDELHRILPPDPQLPVREKEPFLPFRVRRRLAELLHELLILVSGSQWHLNALLTEIGLATYVRHRLQEGRQDELAQRLAGVEEELALLRRRLDGEPPAAG